LPARRGCTDPVEGTSPAPVQAAPNSLFLRHSAAIAGRYVTYWAMSGLADLMRLFSR
jgi:hypothetical protein